jgi:acetyl-CoA synthetase
VFISNQPRFDARGTLQAMMDHGVQTFCAPPTVWRMLVQQDMAPYRGALRELCSAGEPLNPEVIEHVRKVWDMTIREAYGQTETTVQIACFPGQTVKPGSMGQEAPGYRIRLLDPEDREVEEGEVSIMLDPPPAGLMRGYQQDDGSFAPLGTVAYRTGDVATKDADGYFTYVGRADDVFKASDYRISPFELESALIEHEAVAEAAVVPAPDAVRLAVPKAFIALVQGAEPNRETMLSIFRHLRERLAPFKRVRRLEVGELPKTISGKIRRVELRRTEEQRFAAGARPEGEWREEDFPELR